MKNSLSSIFVLVLMCFTIGYGLINYPEMGLLEAVAKNSTDNASNLSSITAEHSVAMSPKDNSIVTEDINSTNAILPDNNIEVADKFNTTTPVESSTEEITSEKTVTENTVLNPNSTQPIQSVSEQPIPVPEPIPVDAGDGDISMPIPVNNTTKKLDSLEEKDITEAKPEPFGREEQLSTEPSKPEKEKPEVEKITNENSTKSGNKDSQNNIDNPIKQVTLEQPIEQNRGTIPRKTIPLDKNDEVSDSDKEHQSTTQEEGTSEKNLTSEATSTSEESSTNTNTKESMDSLPSLIDSTNVPEPIDSQPGEQDDISSNNNKDATNQPESAESQLSSEPTELADNWGFQIPASGYISVKRFPATEKAVEPIYYTNMDRFILDK